MKRWTLAISRVYVFTLSFALLKRGGERGSHFPPSFVGYLIA